MTLGSLFDGAGGFPLAGTMAGITPVWAAEIEPLPIRVTTRRFPDMRHCGDVSVLNGAALEPVDIVTFGSPCQDMSVAGSRTGLKGNRSCLFYEAVRIVSEMRAATNGVYPRYIVWENVPGAFSSNGGEDFRAVLQAVCSIADKSVHVPGSSKWLSAGEILGDGYSVAWRTVDAQYWGVPQMRRRVYLVADFGGDRAGQIQFDCDRLYRDSQAGGEAGEEAGEEVAGAAGAGSETAGGTVCLNDQGGSVMSISNGVTATLRAQAHGHLPVVCRHTVQAVLRPYVIGDQQVHSTYLSDKARTLNCRHTVQAVLRYLTPLECCRLQGFPDYWCSGLETPEPTEEEVSWWYDIFETHRRATRRGGKPRSRAQVRKWLQHPRTDSAEYRMWGNSLAIPNAYHVLAGITEQEGRKPW